MKQLLILLEDYFGLSFLKLYHFEIMLIMMIIFLSGKFIVNVIYFSFLD